MFMLSRDIFEWPLFQPPCLLSVNSSTSKPFTLSQGASSPDGPERVSESMCEVEGVCLKGSPARVVEHRVGWEYPYRRARVYGMSGAKENEEVRKVTTKGDGESWAWRWLGMTVYQISGRELTQREGSAKQRRCWRLNSMRRIPRWWELDSGLPEASELRRTEETILGSRGGSCGHWRLTLKEVHK